MVMITTEEEAGRVKRLSEEVSLRSKSKEPDPSGKQESALTLSVSPVFIKKEEFPQGIATPNDVFTIRKLNNLQYSINPAIFYLIGDKLNGLRASVYSNTLYQINNRRVYEFLRSLKPITNHCWTDGLCNSY